MLQSPDLQHANQAGLEICGGGKYTEFAFDIENQKMEMEMTEYREVRMCEWCSVICCECNCKAKVHITLLQKCLIIYNLKRSACRLICMIYAPYTESSASWHTKGMQNKMIRVLCCYRHDCNDTWVSGIHKKQQ